MRLLQAARGTAITTEPAREFTEPEPPTDAAQRGVRVRRLRVVIAAIAVVCYALDRLTKRLALTRLDPADPPSYLGGLVKLRLISNPGAAFSLGSSATVGLSVLALVAFVAVLVGVVPRVRTRLGAAATGLALAGIAGNLTDRLTRPPGVLRGHVVDFIALPHFAIFNVADICITSTAALLILVSVRSPERSTS